MDIREITAKLPALIRKYRYPILVLAIGLVFLAWPEKSETKKEQPATTTAVEEKADVAQQLKTILAQIQGVGRVEVLLTVKTGETTVYQSDEDIASTENSSTIRSETVIITGSDRQQQALVSQILSPEYLGAVVVCQGADNSNVCLAVVEAVSKATGLGSDRITVLKMK